MISAPRRRASSLPHMAGSSSATAAVEARSELAVRGGGNLRVGGRLRDIMSKAGNRFNRVLVSGLLWVTIMSDSTIDSGTWTWAR